MSGQNDTVVILKSGEGKGGVAGPRAGEERKGKPNAEREIVWEERGERVREN